MKTKTLTLIILITLFNISVLKAQYSTQIFDNKIHTLQLYHVSNPLSLPVTSLNESSYSLKLSFDDFREDPQSYYYTLIHCDAEWNPSDISKSDYLKGFYESEIRDYEMSFNTLQSYVHYNLKFPDEDVKPYLSGNYLIKVYPQGEEENPIFVAGFMIVDKRVSVSPNIRQATNPRFNEQWQEVDFSINLKNSQIINPTSTVKVIILQNDRTDNEIYDIKPSSYENDRLIYDYEKGNLFQGGNEFRNFDFSNFNFITNNVNKIRVYKNCYQILLHAFPLRNKSPYIFDEDINGNYLIETKEYQNADTEADYAKVYFTLPAPYPMVDGDLYVGGRFNHWHFDNTNKMQYNYEKNWYEATIYLKQGYYSFMYMFKEFNQNNIDLTWTENSFSETQNDYTFYVYYREPGGLYDQLLFVDTFSNYK